MNIRESSVKHDKLDFTIVSKTHAKSYSEWTRGEVELLIYNKWTKESYFGSADFRGCSPESFIGIGITKSLKLRPSGVIYVWNDELGILFKVCIIG